MPDLSKQLLLYNGYDQVPVVDYTTDTDWQQTELANNASNGDGAESTWVVDVPDGDVPDHRGPTGTKYISAHNRLKLFVGSNTIWRGRDSGKGIERGPTRGTRPQEWHVTASDPNAELQGMIVHNWVRGAETDVARFQALVTDYLSGSPRPSTNLNGSTHVSGSNTISMPAKTYTGVTPAEIVAELARASDKDAFVDVDDNIHYHGHDYTGFDSPLRISDDIADLNSTTLLTIEPKTNEEGLDQITVLRSYYGADEVQDSVQVVDNTHRLTTDYWEDVWFDDESVTAAQAADVARKVLDTRRLDQISYTVRVGLPGVIQDGNGTPMTGDYCYMLKAGMRIAFKARAARGGIAANGSRIGDTFQMCHIREIRWTFPGPDQYWADLVLERPIRASRGRGQPAATTPKPPSSGTGDPPGFVDADAENGENANLLTLGFDVPAGTDQALVAFTIGQNTCTGVLWDSDGSLSGVPTEAFTKIDGWSDIISSGLTQRVSAWYLLNPTAASDATSNIKASFGGSLANAFGVFLLNDVNQTDPFGNYAFAENNGATSSVSVDAVATQTVVNFAGWMSVNVTPAAPTADAGQTQAWAKSFNNSAGRGDIAHGGGYGDSTPTWSLGSAKNWVAVALAINGNGTVGDTTEPVGETGSGDPGTGGTFAPINHVHELGLNSEDGEHYLDATGIQYDPTASGLEATDLQESTDELADRITVLEAGDTIVPPGDFIVGTLSNPPTQSEIEATIGAPAARGTVYGLQDSGTEKRYLAISDGVQWHIVPIVVPAEVSGVTALTSAPAGGWAQTHPVDYYNGVTYFSYVRGDNGNIEARTYTHATSTVSSATVVHAALLADTHASPSLVVAQLDHRIHIFHSNHAGSAMHEWISTNAEDISAGTDSNIDSQLGGSGYTYPMVADLDSGLYLIIRPYGGASADQIWSYAVSTVNGTWSALTDFFTVSGRTAYPYLNKTGDDRIDFMALDGSSLESNESILFFSFDAIENEWTAADGTVLSLPVGDQAEIMVWDGSVVDDALGRYDVRRGLDGHPRVLFASMNGATYTLRHARWDGSAWVFTALFSGTEPVQGDASFDSMDTNIIYFTDSSNEIRRLTTLDEVTWSSETLTTGTTSVYPTSPDNHHPSLPVLWLTGSFTDSATYNVGTSGYGLTAAAGSSDHLQRIVVLDNTTLKEIVIRKTSGGDWEVSFDGSSWETLGGAGATALDDLTDVTISSPAEGDMLRFDGSVWVNTPGRWEPVTDGVDTFVWDGDEIVMGWKDT